MPLDLGSLKKALTAMEDLAVKAEDQTVMEYFELRSVLFSLPINPNLHCRG